MSAMTAVVEPASTSPMLPARLREDFPALAQRVRGKRLVYLDNAATAQKPRAVLDALMSYYAQDCANVHRSAYELGERASERYEAARETARRFVNAAHTDEIVFVRGATEGINLVAQAFGRTRLGPGDEVIVSALEHHSNIVPWQLVCEARGAALKVLPINRRGEVEVHQLDQLMSPHTRLVAISHVSNALGSITDIEKVVAIAHRRGVPVLVDGAQAAPHVRVDVQRLGCDFYVFSGHKVYGPTGIGVLFGRRALLNELPPYQGGGDMIRSVSFEKTTYAPLPHKFEAGTPHIAGAIGLGAALDYVQAVGIEAIAAHEQSLLDYATARLAEIRGLRILGTARHKAGVISFVIDGIHPHDIATIVDQEGVAIRAGHHCAQPVWQHYGVTASARASFGMYNTHDDVNALVFALKRVTEVFRR